MSDTDLERRSGPSTWAQRWNAFISVPGPVDPIVAAVVVALVAFGVVMVSLVPSGLVMV